MMSKDDSKPMWLGLVLGCLIVHAETARAQLPAAPGSRPTFGSSTWGGRGTHRAMSAFAAPTYALTLTASDDYAVAWGAMVAGDQITRARQHVHLALSPMVGLEVGVSQRVMSMSYRSTGTRSLQILGDPALHLKYGRAVGPKLAIGAYAGLQLPTSVEGAGLVGEAFRLPMAALISYLPHKRAQLSANVGFMVDESNRLRGIAADDRVARFAFEINRTHQVTYALAAQGRVSAGRHVELAPYIEWTGGIGTAAAASLRAAPSRVSLGLQGYLAQSRGLELNLGADVRVAGGPTPAAIFAGEAPWSIFGQVAIHLGECRPGPANGNTAPTPEGDASGAADVPDAYDGRHERDASVPFASAHAANTFLLVGTVTDAVHQTPAMRAHLVFSDAPGAILSSDDAMGHFASWPLVSDGPKLIVRVTAPGYVDQDVDVPRGAPGTTVQLPIVLQRAAPKALGLVQGSIRHAKTGAPIAHATVLLMAEDDRVHAGPNGRFMAQMSPGTRRALIRAPGFVDQSRLVRVEAGNTAVLIVDLQPKNAPGR